MVGVILPGVTGGLLLLFWVWAVFDVIATDSLLVRSLPKMSWLILVVILPSIGGVAWLLLGRPEGAGMSLGGQRALSSTPLSAARRPRTLGPEDQPGWSSSTNKPAPSRPRSSEQEDSLAIRERKLMEKEAELAKREAALEAASDDELDEPES